MGELEGQEVLKQKIEEQTGIPVIIPSFGETYELEENSQLLEREEKFVNYDQVFLRLDVLEKIEKLKDQIGDIEEVVKEDINTNDIDVLHLKNRIKEIGEQIQKLIL